MSSQDPREYINDQEEKDRVAQEGHQVRIWTAMPAVVTAVNRAAMTCECQIAIQGLTMDQDGNINNVPIANLLDVPIVFPSAGGFTMAFPIKVDDEVLVVFASRCIDSWWQNGGVNNQPLEIRMHDLSDGFAIPGPRSQPRVVESLSDTDLQIIADDGTALMTLDPSGNAVFAGNVTAANLISNDEVTAKNGTTPVHLTTHIHTGGTLTGGLTGPPEEPS